MNFIKKTLIFLVVLILFIASAGWLYSKTLHPVYNGEIKIKNTTEDVTVYFDDIGVPHINAQNQKDAYLALGYVHAQDRLWQMELVRRIAAGRLSEILGKELLSVDQFFSGLGIEEAANKTIASLDKSSQAYILTQAYLDGVNQFIKNGKTPLEFILLGLEKEKYTIKDIYNVFGYMSFSFAVAHKTDPLLTEIKEKLGAPYLSELLGFAGENLTVNKTSIPEKINASISRAVSSIMDDLPVSPFIGSNSWVIAPEKTKNGKVIFANDPHIGFSQPSVWYQNHIKTPDFEIYGFNIALMPFPLMGHNRAYAYGMTILANDDLNFYIEEDNPENSLEYKTIDGYEKYQLVDKTIHVKNAIDTNFQVKVSRHGPIMNGLIKHVIDERPIAMNWIYTQLPNEMLEVSYGISHANSMRDFKNSVAKIHAPGLNVMYGDAKDNIGWFSSAKLYQLRDGLSSKTYLNGASGNDEIIEYLPFEENPQAINPTWKYVYSANNQPDSVRGKLYQGYYQPQDRAKRIVELLDEKNDFTKKDVSKMIYDVKSSTVSEISKGLLKSVEKSKGTASERKAFSIIENWDGSYLKTSVGPTIFNRFLYEFLKETYNDELGDSFQLFINSQLQDQVLPLQVNREKSVWWDNISSKDKIETRTDIVNLAFKNAIAFLQNQLGENIEDWTWNRVLSIEHEHAIGKAGGLLRTFFNVGPFETIGGNEVINNQIFNLDSTGYYKVTAGPSTRRIVDFSDVENSLAILPTGQSGNVFSEYYKDQTEKYLEGEFVKMNLNQAEIEQSKNVLTLKTEK
jgi:penicillin amidase